MKQNEENMGLPEMFEALKDLIISKNKEDQSVKSILLEVVKKLDAFEKTHRPESDEQREESNKKFQNFIQDFHEMKSLAASINQHANIQEKALHRLIDVLRSLFRPKLRSRIWRLLYKLAHKPFATITSLYLTILGSLIVLLAFATYNGEYWKDKAKANVENSMKFRFIRAKGWASLNMIQWLDSVYNVHDEDMIDRIEQEAKAYEFKQQKHFDYVIRDSERKKQQIR